MESGKKEGKCNFLLFDAQRVASPQALLLSVRRAGLYTCIYLYIATAIGQPQGDIIIDPTYHWTPYFRQGTHTYQQKFKPRCYKVQTRVYLLKVLVVNKQCFLTK